MFEQIFRSLSSEKTHREFLLVLAMLAILWWGYISYLCLSIWPHMGKLFFIGLVIVLSVISVCQKHRDSLFPLANKAIVFRNSTGLLAFMLITAGSCNVYVRHEKRAHERLIVEPEIRQLAETVTYHLLDQSYINYRDFQKALLQGELSEPIRKSLQDQGIVAQTEQALESKDKSLQNSKQVTAVHLKAIVVKDRNSDGFYPVDVTGWTAKQSVSSDQIVEKPFWMHYLISKDSGIEQPAIVTEVSSESASKDIAKDIVEGVDNLDLDAFARRVARHLVDSSYISYEDNSKALVSGELSSSVVRQLQAAKDLPKSLKEMNAICSQLKKDRQVAAVRFDKVTVGEPNEQGFVPVDVQGQVAVYSLGDTNQSKEPKPFKFRFLIGVKTGTNLLAVTELEKK